MQGEDIRALQKTLNQNGFMLALTGPGSLGFETDGFGPLTEQAIRRLQVAKGLVADGIVGPQTIQSFIAALQ